MASRQGDLWREAGSPVPHPDEEPGYQDYPMRSSRAMNRLWKGALLVLVLVLLGCGGGGNPVNDEKENEKVITPAPGAFVKDNP